MSYFMSEAERREEDLKALIAASPEQVQQYISFLQDNRKATELGFVYWSLESEHGVGAYKDSITIYGKHDVDGNELENTVKKYLPKASIVYDEDGTEETLLKVWRVNDDEEGEIMRVVNVIGEHGAYSDSNLAFLVVGKAEDPEHKLYATTRKIIDEASERFAGLKNPGFPD